MKPTVSIIIPVYNCGKYLTKCFDSLLNQSFEYWEAIVVNDGSRDNSLEIMREYELLDSRFRIIDQPNSGVVTARVTALTYCTGKYLTFLDADDRLTPDAIILMVEAMERDSADICVGGYSLEWEQNGKIVEINRPKRFDSAKGCFRYCLANGEMFLAIKMYRTELFKRVVDIPRDIIIQEDIIGLTQYLEHAERATSVDKSIYTYLKRPEGASSRTSYRHIESLLTVSEFLLSNNFAMTMADVVKRNCANIVLHCLRTSVNEVRACAIWHSFPMKYRLLAHISLLKALAKSRLKQILGH